MATEEDCTGGVTDMNRRFAELCGWNCPQCGGSGWIVVPAHAPDCQGECRNCPVPEQAPCDKCWGDVPDFAADPRLVFEAIYKIGKFEEFVRFLWLEYHGSHEEGSEAYKAPIDLMMDKTGKTRDRAIEWLDKLQPVRAGRGW